MRWWVAVVLCACGATAPAVVDDPAPPDDATRHAGGERARELVAEVQSALRRGDVDGLHAVVDPSVLAIGPRGVHGSRTDVLMALRAGFAAGRAHRVAARNLQVVASPTGRSAFATGEVTVDGAIYRVSGVAAEVDGLWQLSVVHAGRVGAKGNVAGEAVRGDGGVLAGKVEEALAGDEAMARQLAPRRDVVVMGNGPGEITRGATPIRKKWKKTPPPKMRLRATPRAGVTADGGIGWVAAELDVAGAPRRGLFIYETDGRGGWQLVVVHTSATANR
jgi:hypothetical protein